MTRDLDTYLPNGEPSPGRWASARHLFDDGPGAVREETVAERWERAGLFFEARDYATAARLLAGVVEEFPDQVAPRLLLARALYHSAQLGRAEEQLREVIARDPVEPYAHLMLGRTLQRRGRDEEAAVFLRLADALSGPPAPAGR
ncbi:tetratricopeptide repeat protein [Streptomyces sp. NBC_01803]|uniref:tetratricopeptide repeat protein n=1 Tax=Streptomyces sp. NBC_01803 TaxID=2975946 RepID=UPI002DD93C8A|nr:tetratricopeptide repeat protein [Streptomyces sp. NBC_01803]WSA43374.1 tetratricopeptide repeat protein [Streptomyces sp. NBC_01803]